MKNLFYTLTILITLFIIKLIYKDYARYADRASCLNVIEHSSDLVKISKGYNCLAKEEIKENKSKSSVFRAIKYKSFALEASYNKKIQQEIIDLIYGKAHKIENDFDEYKFLLKLMETADDELKSKASYRLSLINLFGRTSSLDKFPKYNLKEAANFKNKVRQFTHIQENRPVNIVFSLNNNEKYIEYAMRTIASIVLNADLDTKINFYIVMDYEDLITNNNKTKLQKLKCLGNYETNFLESPFKNMNIKNGIFADHKVRLLFQRFMIENLVPELDIAISLDVDIMVHSDLYELQNKIKFKNIIAAAPQINDNNLIKYCNFSDPYVNAGVVVQNLQEMRDNNKFILVNEYIHQVNSKKKSCIDLLDQDILNIAYKNNITFISKRWNNIKSLDGNHNIMPFITHFAGLKPQENDKSKYLLYSLYSDLVDSIDCN